MASIKFLREANNNVITNSGGSTFYPVTTINAVYVDPEKTIKDILYGAYDPLSDVLENNGIYKWLENISNRFGGYVTNTAFNRLNSDVMSVKTEVSDFGNSITSMKSLLDNVLNNFNKEISRLDNKIYVPVFDDMPTKGSPNLLSSGSIFSYFSKLVSNNAIKFTQVTDLDEYEGYNGEIVLYLGPTIEKYTFGCLYICNITYTRNPDSVCHEKIKNIEWQLLGNILSTSNVDLSNYYVKPEIDTMFRNLDIKPNLYYPGDNIRIDNNNVISAIIPKVDLSNYYTKTEVDEKLVNVGTGGNVYVPGDNIVISGNKISALVPDISNLSTTQYVDSAIANIKQVEYTAGDNVTILNNTISVGTDNELSELSNAPVSNSTVTKALDTKVDTSSLKRVALTGDYNDLINKPTNSSYAFTTNSDNVSISTEEIEGVTKVSIDVSIPEQESITVVDGNKTLQYGEKTSIATIGGTEINVTMPPMPTTPSIPTGITDVKVNGESVVKDNVAEITIDPSTGSDLSFKTLTGSCTEKIDISGPGAKIQRFAYNWFLNTKRLNISNELTKLDISAVYLDTSNGEGSWNPPSVCIFVITNKNKTADTELLFRYVEISDSKISNSVTIKHNTFATVMLSSYTDSAKYFAHRLKILDEIDLDS